jgi:hypothetical protein
VHLSEHYQLDMAFQIELQRWDDDGGAIVSDSRCALAQASHHENTWAA